MSFSPSAAQIEWHMHLLRQWMAPTQFPTEEGRDQDLFSQLEYAQTFPSYSMSESNLHTLPIRTAPFQHTLQHQRPTAQLLSPLEDLRQDSVTPGSCPSGEGGSLDDASCNSEAPSSYLSSEFPDFGTWDDASFPLYNFEDTIDAAMPDATSSPPPVQPATEVDALMLRLKPEAPIVFSDPSTVSSKPKKHLCPQPGCSKSFSQMTHLKIHHRSHTGEKPYVCAVGTCGQSFSQLGNLRTHERRHFGQKPNRNRAHSASARYECRLDSCDGKPFTQLGNLKSHQNKFHKQTLVNLSNRFADVDDRMVAPEEREMMAYFQSLYRNCNKNIKGRGKGRKVEVLQHVR